ncbi:similar to Saccharomyces cerevisiae YDL001W RMD1 Cytoplasmic protein required for sporulation [Geotrichum candidum]|nr:similar to Saccharomyces cerevisiae YDL001W RMD1 Cytoplasmic protein required for sporulation [Geotrichum candidum]
MSGLQPFNSDSEQAPLLQGASSAASPSITNQQAQSPTSKKAAPIRPSYPKDYRPHNTRLGPQRTSYTTQKLKLLPDEPFPEDEESGRDVYSQVTRIKDTPARKDAERLGKAHRAVLPRVTAYCTASSYKMRELARYLSGRKRNKAAPKLFDECLYTTYSYKRTRASSNSSITSNTPPVDNAGLMRLDDEGGEIDVEMTGRSDIFLFEYGVVVYWGFTEEEEKRFLKELARFENEKLADEDVEVEEFNYYITKSYQPRIYNDFITLRDGSNYMVKLSISHALAQSVKISLFEELVDNTIEDTQDLPEEVALTGKISMNRKNIMKSIGELFILRINVNLHGSVLDSPELMWSEPHLEPIYQATRGYLEINQRVSLLNQRLEVISDLLQMLKEQLSHANEEYLEFIVIVLIGAEILVAIVNVVVDLIAAEKF